MIFIKNIDFFFLIYIGFFFYYHQLILLTKLAIVKARPYIIHIHTTFRFMALVLTYFCLTKGRVTFFRPTIIVVSSLHLVVLISKVFNNQSVCLSVSDKLFMANVNQKQVHRIS